LWIGLRAGVDTRQLATRALAQGVVVEPKTVFFAGARPPARTMRPGCSSIDARQIAPAIARLATLPRQ